MAGASLLTLLDDITTLTKIAAKKTSGVVGDDLALNAEQVAGVNAERELPVIWAVAKGSLKNKAILIPSALILSAVAPVLITPLLMVGGLYLCYEGSEKIIEKIEHKLSKKPHGIEDDVAEIQKSHHPKEISKEEEIKIEKEKILGAIKTDFVLSGEIIIIALGTVAAAPLITQAGILTTIGVVMTVGVYGVVAGIVNADDVGLFMTDLTKENFKEKMDSLNERTKTHHPALKLFTVPTNRIISTIGKTLFDNEPSIKALNFIGEKTVNVIPYFMKTLTVVGTVAMFTVGGEILSHGLPFVHGIAEMLPHGGVLGTLSEIGLTIGIGVSSGMAAVGAMHFKEPIVKALSPVINLFNKIKDKTSNIIEGIKNSKDKKNDLIQEKQIDLTISKAIKESSIMDVEPIKVKKSEFITKENVDKLDEFPETTPAIIRKVKTTV